METPISPSNLILMEDSGPTTTFNFERYSDLTLNINSSVSNLSLKPKDRRRKMRKKKDNMVSSMNSPITENATAVTLDPTSTIPGEIRNLIWELCIPRRLVKASRKRLLYKSHASALSINRESRSAILAHYHHIKTIPGLFSSNPTNFFNPENDLLCLGNISFEEYLSIQQDHIKLAKYVYISIESLGYQSATIPPYQILANMNGSLKQYYPSLKDFKHLEHVFVTLSGKKKHSWDRKKFRNGTIKGHIERCFKRILASDWRIPPFTAVEGEEELLKIWEAWRC